MILGGLLFMSQEVICLEPSDYSIKAIDKQNKKERSIYLLGSKSYTNRALIIASLASGETQLVGTSLSDDSKILIKALGLLGIIIEEEGQDLLVKGGSFIRYKGMIDIGGAGTAMRFLLPLCCMLEGSEISLCGDKRMHERPIGALVDALRSLGANIKYEGQEGYPPLHIKGGLLQQDILDISQSKQQNILELDISLSSQYLSALLMIAPYVEGGLSISTKGEQVSKSYIEMTLEVMRHFGVVVRQNNNHYDVRSGQIYKNGRYLIEGDLSGASYFWGIAAITGQRVRIYNVHSQSRQGDLAFLGILEKMGCCIRWGLREEVSYVEVWREGELKGIDIDMRSMPDTAQTLAVIATIAKGQTHIRGLSTLRYKETDRLNALQKELRAIQIESDIDDDSILIVGGKPKSAFIRTYGDHRMAMSFAMLASIIPHLQIENPSVVSKSYPYFWEEISKLHLIEIRKGLN